MFRIEQNQPTYSEVLKRASSFLEKNGQSAFAAEWLLRERLMWSKTDLVTHFRQEIPVKQIKQFEKDINEFHHGKPMQHIIGHDWFYNRRFSVNEHTLIPRPETEEWLDRVLQILPDHPLTVLDIGTGTGIIALTVKSERPKDEVTATDISFEALQVAQKNARDLGVEVRFLEGSVFEPVAGERFDVVISNPPYIGEEEIKWMDQSVLEHEPKSALFAENEGLAIYEEIAENMTKFLAENGMAFFEIGFRQGAKVAELFRKYLPNATIEVWQDFSGLDRVVAVIR